MFCVAARCNILDKDYTPCAAPLTLLEEGTSFSSFLFPRSKNPQTATEGCKKFLLRDFGV